jgi:hypothetical protein
MAVRKRKTADFPRLPIPGGCVKRICVTGVRNLNSGCHSIPAIPSAQFVPIIPEIAIGQPGSFLRERFHP